MNDFDRLDRTDPRRARDAATAARLRAAATDAVVSNARDELARIRRHRETNHYSDKLRRILRREA